jgi:GntR family transcriptional regulator/MocR family aminotransferase
MQSIATDLVLQRMDRRPGGALNRRLYDCLRAAILDGALAPASALPASRDLAREAGLSRNTVLHAYAQLQAEGYVQARVGSGTFVAATTPDSQLSSGHQPAAAPAPMAAPVLARRAQRLLAQASAAPRQWGAFMPGVPDVTQFPRRLWSRIQSQLWRDPAPELLSYAHGGGLPQLRAAIAEHLRVARSVRCEPDQILVTEGVHQAIDLSLRMLVDPRDSVWVEEPGYWGFHALLRADRVRVRPLRIEPEDDGPQAGWPRGGKPPRLIFVTPSHQYPLGSVMSLARRRELLEFARGAGSWIVEDDYDSEFRFAGRPIPAMQGLEPDAPVIYVGTFSKTLFPGLRVAYMVLPRALVAPFRTAHADLYREGRGLTHAALATLIDSGHYAAHIRRMRVVYARRRALLSGLVQAQLGPDSLHAHASNAGLHLTVSLPHGSDDRAIVQAAQARGVLARPLSAYYQQGAQARPGLLLGYACVADEHIAPAFEVLREVLPHVRSAWPLPQCMGRRFSAAP